MKITVILNSYNYERFIAESLESVLAQSRRVDEIIVVDDGSSDRSCQVIERYRDARPDLILIRKENGGQLSTTNAAAPHVTGDVVFFIDSDDVWTSDYVDRIMKIYQSRPVDYVFCAFREFDGADRIVRKYPKDTDLGFSTAFTYFKRVYIGGPTATLSMRRTLFDKVFPVPLAEDWRVCADLPLVMGASLAGGHKYYCAEPLVNYRIHPVNAHKTMREGGDYDYRFTYRRDLVVSHFAGKFGLSERMCADLIDVEVRVCREDIKFSLLWRYLTIIIKSSRPWVWRLEKGVATIRGYLRAPR